MLRVLRAGIYNSLYSQKSTRTPEHTLPWYEIELFISGKGEMVIDGKAYPNAADNLVFGRPGQTRSSTDSYICYFVHIETDERTDVLENISTAIPSVNPSIVQSCFEEIIRLRQNPNDCTELLVQSKVYELLYHFYSQTLTAARAEKLHIDHKVITNAIEFIDENFSKDILLNDIADSVSFSPTYFHKIFTAYTGKTPHKYLLEKRIVAAKHYLLTTDIPISDIAKLCGFSSFSYFDYQFKKQVGTTPHRYRESEFIIEI